MNQLLKPPFSDDSAKAKVQQAQDAWNTRNPSIITEAYSEGSVWRNRDEFFAGHEAIKAFLIRKWARELHYRLLKELWAYTGNRISVRFEYEWQDARSGQWLRTHGNEQWEFDDDGLMCRCDMSANDVFISADERRIRP